MISPYSEMRELGCLDPLKMKLPEKRDGGVQAQMSQPCQSIPEVWWWERVGRSFEPDYEFEDF
jgi:hypothetical protein